MQNAELFDRMAHSHSVYVVLNRHRDSNVIPRWEDLPSREIRLLGEARERMGGQWAQGPRTLELWLLGQISTMAFLVTEGERAHLHAIAQEMGMSLRNEYLGKDTRK